MLAKQGQLSEKKKKKTTPIQSERVLAAIRGEIQEGKFPFRREFEDIHMNVESASLRIDRGGRRGRLHTARSRNDQVATDFAPLGARSLWPGPMPGWMRCKERFLGAGPKRHAATIMPGFTHMQPAQPVTFGHHCLAYIEMAARDRGRFFRLCTAV